MTAASEPRKRAYRRGWRVCRVRVNADDFERLSRAAVKRHIEPDTLLDRIVTTAIGADLIDAVLDDA